MRINKSDDFCGICDKEKVYIFGVKSEYVRVVKIPVEGFCMCYTIFGKG